MTTRAEQNEIDPDLGVLAARLLLGAEGELFSRLAEQGFGDLLPRHGAVMAHIEETGTRATELSRRSGQHKQVIGKLVDELEDLGYVERRPDPDDRRAKLVCPTERGLAEMRAGGLVMTEMQQRHAQRLGPWAYAAFKAALIDIIDHQRRYVESPQLHQTPESAD